MKLLWLGYLVYSLGNCAMKLCIETDLRDLHFTLTMRVTSSGSNTMQHVHAQHWLSGPSKCALRFVLLHFSQLCSHFSPLFHTSRCKRYR